MKKKAFKKILSVFIFIIISNFLLLTACNTDHPVSVEPEDTGNTPAPNYDEIMSMIQYDDHYSVSIHYPRFYGKQEINESIYKLVLEIKENFLNAMSEAKMSAENKEAGMKFELNVEYNSFSYNQNIKSVQFEVRTYLGGAHDDINIITKIYNKEAKEIELSELFQKDSDYLNILSQKSREYLRENETLKQYDYFEEELFEEGTSPKEENFTNYVLKPEALTIFFAPYAIAPWAFGTISVDIPLKDIPFNSSIADNLETPGLPTSTPSPTNVPDVTPTTVPSNPNPPIVNDPDFTMPPRTDVDLTGIDPNKPYIALTFDDGPHKINTPRLLDALKERNVKATFFMLGKPMDYYPKIVQRMSEEGHELGSHTVSHLHLDKLTKEEILNEVNDNSKKIFEITGKYPTLLRPPYGSVNDLVKETVNLPMILWNIDPEDWKYRDAQHVSEHIINKAKSGDIILLHDIHETSVDAAIIVMDKLTEKGYQFVTVSQLMALKGEELAAGKIYR